MNPTWKPALDALGASYLYPYQELVIARILGPPGLRQAVVLPTGAGKSLCFQVPAMLFDSPTLVVYPLRSLMADQKHRCDAAGIASAVLQGGQTRRERNQVFADIAAGRVRLVLTNPETLTQPRVVNALKTLDFAHAAIDEAHCFTLWGKDFRPAYRELPRALEALGIPRITAFTATASPLVTEDWTENLFRGQDWTLVRASADRPNLDFSREAYVSLRYTLPRLLMREQKPAVVFCRSREKVRRWAHHLHRETGLDVRHYHAGLTRPEKASVESWFHSSRDGVLLATNAYGMGVDKSNIRTVVHLEAPARTEDYLQEAGRAGRDGNPARAILLVPARVGTERSEDCWRAQLLSVFGEPLESCAGCDACRGQAHGWPPELAKVCAALAHHLGRLDRNECQALLRSHWGPQFQGLERYAGWGLLREVDDLTFSELWSGLEGGGWLEFSGRNDAKGLLRRVNLI